MIPRRYWSVAQRLRCASHLDEAIAGWRDIAWESLQQQRGLSKKAKKQSKPHAKGHTVQESLAELNDALSLEDAENRMKKALEHLKGELANIRSGRATPGMLDHVMVTAADGSLPLKALGTVTVKDSHVLSISLFDAEACPSVMAAIDASPLQLQSKVTNQEELLVLLPKQTQETVDALGKIVRKEAEHSKTIVRNARKVGMAEVKKLSSEDDRHRGETVVDSLTEKYIREIEEMCENKKRELRSS